MALSLYKIEYRRICSLSDEEAEKVEDLGELNDYPPTLYTFGDKERREIKKFMIKLYLWILFVKFKKDFLAKNKN